MVSVGKNFVVPIRGCMVITLYPLYTAPQDTELPTVIQEFQLKYTAPEVWISVRALVAGVMRLGEQDFRYQLINMVSLTIQIGK